jgi:hypothetical protein
MTTPDATNGDRPSLLTHEFGFGQVDAHIDSLYRDLASGHTDHFTDTDWWIVQWVST